MPNSGSKEGFVGEKVYRLSREQIETAKKDSLFNDLHVTDIGYFPNASNHLVDRTTTLVHESILIYCTGGEGWLEVNGRRAPVLSGQFIVIPNGTPHSYGSDSGWQIYWLHFGGDATERLLEKLGGSFDAPLPGPEATEAIEMFEKMISRAEKGLTIASVGFLHVSSWHLLGLFILGLSHPPDVGPVSVQVDACIHFMKKHMSGHLTLCDMAEHAGYSVSHFSQLFRERTGYSPIDFYIQVKVQHAATILATSQEKVLDVARRCGYGNPYYFSRIFRKVTGYSPRQYRQQFSV